MLFNSMEGLKGHYTRIVETQDFAFFNIKKPVTQKKKKIKLRKKCKFQGQLIQESFS